MTQERTKIVVKIRQAIKESLIKNIKPRFIILNPSDRAELWEFLSKIGGASFPGENGRVFGLHVIENKNEIIELE